MDNHLSGQLSAMLRRVLPQSIVVRREVRVMESWWNSSRQEQAARAVEARLFFDPPLLDAASRSQRQKRWQARFLAGLLVTMIGAGVPVGDLHAEDAPAEDPGEATDEERTLLERLLEAFGLTGDEGGSADPEGGDPITNP